MRLLSNSEQSWTKLYKLNQPEIVFLCKWATGKLFFTDMRCLGILKDC